MSAPDLVWEPYTDGTVVGQRAEHDIFEFDISVDPDIGDEARVVWCVYVSTYSYDEGPGSDEVGEGQADDFDAAKTACQEWLDTWLAEQAKIEADLRALEEETDEMARRIEERDALAAMEEPGA